MKAIISVSFLAVGLLLTSQTSADSAESAEVDNLEDFLEGLDFPASALETKTEVPSPSSNYVPSYNYEFTTIHPTYELVGSNGNLTSQRAQSAQTEDSDSDPKKGEGPSKIKDIIDLIKKKVIEMQKSITPILKKWVEDYTGGTALPIAKFSRARLDSTRAINTLEKSLPEDEFYRDGRRNKETDKKILEILIRFQRAFESVKDDFNEKTAEKGVKPISVTEDIDKLIEEVKNLINPDPPINGREDEEDCC